MTRRPLRTCRHCGYAIYPTGREWAHWHNNQPACIVESRYTGTRAEPADDCTGPRGK